MPLTPTLFVLCVSVAFTSSLSALKNKNAPPATTIKIEIKTIASKKKCRFKVFLFCVCLLGKICQLIFFIFLRIAICFFLAL